METKRLNEQVKRNLERFPVDFMFELTKIEVASLRSQFATLEKGGTHSKYLIMAFSEHGILMLSSVLRSETAVNVGVQIINAFVETRRFFTCKYNLAPSLYGKWKNKYLSIDPELRALEEENERFAGEARSQAKEMQRVGS